MLSTLASRWKSVVSAFWFLPAVIVVSLAGLALVLVSLDRRLETASVDVLFAGDPSAARGILTAIAAALATIAGVVFSIMIVTLQLVSSEFTPRALPNLLKDRLNQVAAGSFVGVFVYCLLVLRSVRSDEGVPAVSVTVAIALGLAGLAVLLVFVHHVSNSIQLGTIASESARATLAAVDRLYPDRYRPQNESGESLRQKWGEGETPVEVRPSRPGYIQAIAHEQLVKDLHAEGLRIAFTVGPGDFVTEETPVALLWSRKGVGERQVRTARRAIKVASQRDTRQDVAFGARQLADIAVRALSPGVNDPTTALTCIHYLGAILERLAARSFPSPVRRLEDLEAVVVVPQRSFGELLDEAFGEIARFGSSNARIAEQTLRTLERVAKAAAAAGAWDRVAAVVDLAEAVAEPALADARTRRDETAIEEALGAVRGAVAREASE